jgi:hypothetical protein
MRAAWLLGVLALAAGCASAPRPGPTEAGIAVLVPAHDKAVARRQAIESLLPLFLSDDARREKSAALDKALFSAPKATKAFVGRLKTSKRGGSLVEVKVNALSAALQRAGLVRPPGYRSGADVLLLALGDRAVGPNSTERFAADALETALFGRGIQAHDADDQLLKLEHPITAKTEAGTVSQAAAAGWAGVVTGGVADTARREVQSNAWRGRARYTLALYGIDRSTEPARFTGDGEALDVSSFSAVTRAVEAASQEAALRVEGLLARRRAGRATIGVLVSGYKDPAFLKRLLGDLRRIEGIDGAALISWQELDEMALFHAYASTLAADTLAAKLINSDPTLRITAVETEDGRLTIAGPELPASEDRGGEEQ